MTMKTNNKTMERRAIKNTPKSHKNSQIEVVTNWQHTGQVSPQFRRLMLRLLLEPSSQLNNKKGMSDEAS